MLLFYLSSYKVKNNFGTKELSLVLISFVVRTLYIHTAVLVSE